MDEGGPSGKRESLGTQHNGVPAGKQGTAARTASRARAQGSGSGQEGELMRPRTKTSGGTPM